MGHFPWLWEKTRGYVIQRSFSTVSSPPWSSADWEWLPGCRRPSFPWSSPNWKVSDSYNILVLKGTAWHILILYYIYKLNIFGFLYVDFLRFFSPWSFLKLRVLLIAKVHNKAPAAGKSHARSGVVVGVFEFSMQEKSIPMTFTCQDPKSSHVLTAFHSQSIFCEIVVRL